MIQTVPPSPAAQLSVPLTAVHLRGQIRTRNGLEESSLRDLAASIKVHGVLQPVVVTPREDGAWWLVAGERRVLAASLAGLDEIPAVVRTGTVGELAAAQAVENLQREDLSPLDIADGLAALSAQYPKQQDLAAALGKSPAWVSKHRSLTKLPPALHELLAEGVTRDVEMVLDLASLGRIKTQDAQHKFATLLSSIRQGLAGRELVRAALTNAKARAKAEAKGTDEPEGEPESDGETTKPSTAAVFANLKLSPNGLRLVADALQFYVASGKHSADVTQAGLIEDKARALLADLMAR